jgi:ABC-type transporter Mla subunit MlaD
MVERKYKGTPRKRMLEDRNRTAVGLVALAVLVALMATLVVITKVGPGYKRVSADFIQAAALLPKNPDLQEALQDIAVNYGEVNTDQLAAAVEALGRQVRGMPPLVPKAMDNLKRLSTVMAQRRDQFGSMLTTMDIVTSTLRRQQTSIGAMVNEGNQLLGEFVMRQAAFHELLQALTDLVNLLDDTVVTNRAQVESLLANMNTLTGLADKHQAMLRSILQSAPVALRGLANATGTGNALETNFPNGILVDSWMCAISGRAKQFGMIQYYKDCK